MKVTGGDSWGLMPSLSGIRFIEDGGRARGGGSLQQTRPSGARSTRPGLQLFVFRWPKLRFVYLLSRNSIEINIFFPNVVKTKDCFLNEAERIDQRKEKTEKYLFYNL